MIRKILLGVGVAVLSVGLVGCDKPATTATFKTTSPTAEEMKKMGSGAMDKGKEMAKDGMEKAKDMADKGMDKAKDMADKGKDMVKDAGAAAKEAVIKPIMDQFSKIEEKIKGLGVDPKKVATEKFEALKTMIQEFKAAPADKMGDLKTKILANFEELKKSLGM